MDWLTETAVWPAEAPLLMWIKILAMCTVILSALALLTFVFGWVRHLSWWVRVSALVPLAAAVGAAIAGHALHDTYAYWASYLQFGHGPQVYYIHGVLESDSADHIAAVLGWIGLIVTALWLVAVIVGFWRLMLSERRQRPALLAYQP